MLGLSWEAIGPEDNFWRWAMRELGGAWHESGDPETVLHYSTLGGFTGTATKLVVLLWELLPAMKAEGYPVDPAKLRRIENAIACRRDAVLTCPSRLVAEQYPEHAERIVIQPIGVDFDVFHPAPERPMSVGFWSGTAHPMKGFDRIPWDAAERWNIVWKDARSQERMGGLAPPNARQYVALGQRALADVMRDSGFVCASGTLRPFFLVEYEAMACGLDVLNVNGLDKDFEVSDNPRQQLKDMGWDRKDAAKAWRALAG